jgi:hypothetical protein
MSFWLPVVEKGKGEGKGGWHENDYCEIVRDVVGDLVENVELVSDIQPSLENSHCTCST